MRFGETRIELESAKRGRASRGYRLPAGFDGEGTDKHIRVGQSRVGEREIGIGGKRLLKTFAAFRKACLGAAIPIRASEKIQLAGFGIRVVDVVVGLLNVSQCR